MFASSLCKLGRSGSPLARPLVASWSIHACHPTCVAASRRPLSCRSHQRRHSSSKTSSPPNGSRGMAAPQSSPANTSAAEKAEAEKRSTSRAGRRRGKDNVSTASPAKKSKDDAAMSLPSVPSTNHVHPADVAVSAFFSLHRPISVTSSVPPTSTPISFDSIFAPRPKPVRPAAAQVIATLSNTVDALEAASEPAPSYEDSTGNLSLRGAVTAVSVSNDPSSTTQHLDAPPSNNSPLQFPSHLLSGKYKPFSPPSAPSRLNSSAAAMSSPNPAVGELPSATLKKSYSTILTILESTHPNGSKTYTARASPIVAADPSEHSAQPLAAHENPRGRFLHRMRDRQLKWEEYRRGRFEGYGEADGEGEMMEGGGEMEPQGWWAISVKRQRRLKMKKHKYKKLMRKTRNLRRRLERA